MTSEVVVVTATSTMGFTGDVAINPTVVDTNGVAIAGWTATAMPATLTLADGGSQTAMIQVKIPSDSAALAANIKIDLTSTAAPASATSAFTVQKQLHIPIEAGTGTLVPHPHPGLATSINVKTGTSVIFVNNDTIVHRIHGDNGITHEPNDLAVGGTYTQIMTADGQWYCHDHESGTQIRNISVVP